MFEKFLSGNIDNFRQRYEGTYGFFRDEKKKRTLVRLESIGGARCNFVDARGMDYHIMADTQDDMGFEFIPPKSQWYNAKGGAMFTQRLAQRQYSRGVSDRNLTIALLRSERLYPVEVNFNSLSQIYEHPVPTPEALREFQEKKRHSLALSGQFAVCGGRVYVFTEMVGDFKLDGKHISMKLREPDLWRTELTDACKSLQLTAEIS